LRAKKNAEGSSFFAPANSDRMLVSGVRVKVLFLWIGGTRQRQFKTLEDMYLERIDRLILCQRTVVAEERKSDARQVASGMAKEARRVLARVNSGSHLICLDHRGKGLDSRDLANRLRKLEDLATREVALVVGGFMGIPSEVQAQARESWSLGPMTLPHELARLVLLEQTYRALTLIRGLPYHR